MPRQSASRFAVRWVVLAAAVALPGGAIAHTPFYKDRTITVVVPSDSGGTYHVYCQLVQRHLARHLPGNPKIVLQNRPGAGGARAARYMVTAAPRDGTVIAMLNPGSVMLPLLRPGVGFDTRKMQWLGSMSQRTYTVATWHDAPAKTLDDMKRSEVVMGTTGRAATSYLIPSFMNKTVGTRFKIITGYASGGAINLAMERGEIDGRGNFYSGYTGVRPQWLENELLNFVLTLGPPRPEVADMPKLRDFMKTKLQNEMLDLLEVSLYVGQAFYAPPGTPETRMKVLRKGFAAMMADPVTRADAARRRVPMRTQTYRQIEASIARGFGASPEAVKMLRKMLGFDAKQPPKKKS